jgi:hypothetical protein
MSRRASAPLRSIRSNRASLSLSFTFYVVSYIISAWKERGWSEEAFEMDNCALFGMRVGAIGRELVYMGVASTCKLASLIKRVCMERGTNVGKAGRAGKC